MTDLPLYPTTSSRSGSLSLSLSPFPNIGEGSESKGPASSKKRKLVEEEEEGGENGEDKKLSNKDSAKK